jgi:hypothetical protein
MTRPAVAAAATLVALLLIAAPARADWIWPVHGEVITPYRNGDDPYASGQHRGIDIAAEPGTPVMAAVAGEVRFAGTAGSSGLTVSVRTFDGRYDTSYLHLFSTAVSKGQHVDAGETLGAVGTTGERSAQPAHLHFGVRDAGSRHAYHDPLGFLPPSAVGPERPRATPGPIPVPVTPGAEPVRVPAPRAAPRTAPAPERTPAPRRTPVPRGVPAPRSAPAPVPQATPEPGGAPAPHGAPGRHGAPAPQNAPAPHGVPARRGAPAPRVGPASHASPAHSPTAPVGASETPATPDPRPGPDLGWALACLGLLLAAALLGLSEDGRKATRDATRSGRERVAGVLRPLLGRR